MNSKSVISSVDPSVGLCVFRSVSQSTTIINIHTRIQDKKRQTNDNIQISDEIMLRFTRLNDNTNEKLKQQSNTDRSKTKQSSFAYGRMHTIQSICYLCAALAVHYIPPPPRNPCYHPFSISDIFSLLPPRWCRHCRVRELFNFWPFRRWPISASIVFISFFILIQWNNVYLGLMQAISSVCSSSIYLDLNKNVLSKRNGKRKRAVIIPPSNWVSRSI